MDHGAFWALPAAVVVLSMAAGLYGWRLKMRFERDHPKLTRAALKAESEMKAEVVPIRPIRKVVGQDDAA